jgi:ABC-type glycerol-3-phosphate transport system permease component
MNKYHLYRNAKSFAIHVFLTAVALTCLFPLFWMIRASLMTQDTIFTDQSLIPSTIHFGNYVRAWTEGQFGFYLLNSLVYTVVVVFGIVIIASWAAYAFSRLDIYSGDDDPFAGKLCSADGSNDKTRLY